MSTTSSDTVTVSDYILTRLTQLGVKSIFGVPGDFNLAFLDALDDNPNLQWVGCCNELNAAYAADGYARVSKGLGVLVTTFGVGELSALNGVAGAFSERVPVLHIVGVPSTKLQAHRAILHHTLGDGRFHVYHECGAHVTVAQETLTSINGAGAQIDRVIITALTTCRPTYLTLPTDLVPARIPAAPLTRELTPTKIRAALFAPSNAHAPEQAAAVSAIARLYAEAKRPVVLIDVCASRFGVADLVQALVERTGMPFFTTPMSKGLIDEDHEAFAGLYIGDVTAPTVKERFESADLVLSVGLLMSDFNTGNFTFRLPEEHTVELHSDHTIVAGEHFASVTFFTLLPALIEALPPKQNLHFKDSSPENIFASPRADWESSKTIEQEWFYAVFGKTLKTGDVLIGETGTSMFGLTNVHLPRRTMCLTQVLWGSIGWSVGAALGAAVAARERDRRLVVFTGDGSVQVTVQDLSTIIRNGLCPIVVLLNNDGYTIERLINGPERAYNDIQPWNWSTLMTTFGAKPDQVAIHRVETPSELRALLERKGFGDGTKMEFVEVVMGRLDAPHSLLVQAALTHAANEA